MPKAVLDSTILVSAFLIKTGVSYELLQQAQAGVFTICASQEILDEVQKVLLKPRIRKKYHYPDEAITEYVQLLGLLAELATDLPAVHVVRDPSDDMILATALAAPAEYLVSRDKDLLSLGTREQISIVSPEDFITLLRQP